MRTPHEHAARLVAVLIHLCVIVLIWHTISGAPFVQVSFAATVGIVAFAVWKHLREVIDEQHRHRDNITMKNAINRENSHHEHQ